jgi:hypothetical protein
MRTAFERDMENGITTVQLIGELTRTNTTTVRTAIGKAAAECPAAVIVDLSELHAADDVSMIAFATMTFRAQADWGVPVLLCEAGPGTRRSLDAYRTFVALYDDHQKASQAVLGYVPRWVQKHLAPEPPSAAEARTITEQACMGWGLVHLQDDARLIASELVSNAVTHAGSDVTLSLAYTGRYLRIAVHDSSQALPLALRRRLRAGAVMTSAGGLRVVAAVAPHWGATRMPQGKIVWALLRAHQW